MYGLTLQYIAQETGGKLIAHEKFYAYEPIGASIDTRTLSKGELFFAIAGEKTDGHEYLKQAMEKGAIAAVVSRVSDIEALHGFPLVVVENTYEALRGTAALMRRSFKGKVVAVTGSTGKTTTKDMLWSMLNQRAPALRNIGNMNNELGLPLTICALKEKHWAMILEMGMRGLGQIDDLAEISAPDHAIITNIGHTHQEILGSQENIARAKAELLPHIPRGGAVILNYADQSLLRQWIDNTKAEILWIGQDNNADIWADEIIKTRDSDLYNRCSFYACTAFGERERIDLFIPGKHNISNALSAIMAARKLGITWQEIRTGLQNLEVSSMRLEFKKISHPDALIINDTYNASPASMCAALDVLVSAGRETDRKIAVLGDMYELGDYTKEGHENVGIKVSEKGISYLLTVGKNAEYIAEGAKNAGVSGEKIFVCVDKKELIHNLNMILKSGDVILIKGSRGAKKEEIVSALIDRGRSS